MSSPTNFGPAQRRHSFSSFNMRSHRHKSIPQCATSHPDNPIPMEPSDPLSTPLPPPPPPPPPPQSLRKPQPNALSSPRSSGESLRLASDDNSNSSGSDSDTPASTPPNGRLDLPHEKDVTSSAPAAAAAAAARLARRASSPARRQRRASTTYASSSEEIKKLLGDGCGTHFLRKYCCGEGCCMLEALPRHPDPSVVGIHPPDNDAFRFLDLNVAGLALDTQFTKTVDLPESRVSFAPVRKESISQKFPDEAGHEHSKDAVNMYPPTYMKPHPPYSIFSAPVYGARELTKPGAQKRTFHFDIDVTEYPAEGGVDFKVGGAIGVCPPNDPDVVEDVMDQLGIPRFQRDKPIRLHTAGGRWPTIWGEEADRELITTRREVLTWTVDISSTPPNKPLFRLLAEHASAPNEKKILTYLCSAQGQAAFCDIRTGPHITLQQLLHAFPSSKPPLEALCSTLSQLMPRFYSLSNDPHVSSAREGLAGRRLIEVAVTVHDTPAYGGRLRTGVGSGFLERLALQFIEAEQDEADWSRKQAESAAEAKDLPGSSAGVTHVGVAGRRLNLHIPMFRGLMSNPLSREFASDGPMLLIGAGVGMAPFRGFILNRLKNANCANKIWLIQGIRDSMLDEIYQGELGDHEGEIKRIVQSRARPPPISEEDEAVQAAGDSDDNNAAAAKLDPATAGPQKQNQVAKYVQDEVRLQADIVWFVINAIDGRIFVCGSSKGMGEGVESALIDVAMDKGNLDFETAKDFWKGKQTAGQFIMETW